MGYSARRQNVLTCLAALEIVLRGEGYKAEPGAGVAAAIAHYRRRIANDWVRIGPHGGQRLESIPAPLIIDTLKDTFREARAARNAEGWGPSRHDFLGWILSVPDTHQKTVLAALDKEDSLRVVTCATEDEATAIGGRPLHGRRAGVLMIQHAGLYASINTLRGVAMDGKVPMFYMIGLLAARRTRTRRSRATRWSASPSRCSTPSACPTRASRAPTTCT